MRFSLQDVKKQIRRHEGELAISLHFLRSAELHSEITALVALYESQCASPRKSFPLDEIGSYVGDYRLANCLSATLSNWYTWKSPAWTEVLTASGEEGCRALAEANITSSVQLRLTLFDYVNVQYAGFLGSEERSTALTSFASRYHLGRDLLEYLLTLDAEDESILTRLTVEPPSADAVAALYNQWVFEAALCSASEVHFVIDCEAFLESQREGQSAEHATTLSGLGTVIKRLCFLARKLGVYYDLAYESVPSNTSTTLLHLTLYGPQEMTGAPQQYGQRLARLSRLLLSYGISKAHTHTRRRTATAFSSAIRRAEATVHVFQNVYHFSMDGELLTRLPVPAQAQKEMQMVENSVLYDSTIEQSFAEAFASLQRSHGTSGWQLEREPEPLLFSTGETGSSQGIFIPDFALTRETRRIYIEILGFWTPSYRERKLQKLQQLKGRADLVLAFPAESRQTFSILAPDFPLVEYHGQLSATDILNSVQARYDDFEERLLKLDVEHIRAEVREKAFIPEQSCYELLHCYRRSELSRAAQHVLTSEMAYRSGFGLYVLNWLKRLHESFVEWIEAKYEYELSLSDILQAWKFHLPELAIYDDTLLEILISFWPEVEIQHSSIFESRLLVAAHRESVHLRGKEDIPVADKRLASSPKKGLRERRLSKQRRTSPETSQNNLWEIM